MPPASSGSDLSGRDVSDARSQSNFMDFSEPLADPDKLALVDLDGGRLGTVEFEPSGEEQRPTVAHRRNFARDICRELERLKRWAFDRQWSEPSQPTLRIVVSDRFEISRSLAPAWFGQAGWVEFPAWRVMNRKAAILHELVHVLFPNANRLLAEGLAVCLQDEIGGNPAFPNFGQPLHSLAGERMWGLAPGDSRSDNALVSLDLSRLDEIPTPRPLTLRVGDEFFGEEPRGQALIYSLAGSFVQFLIESRGHAAFRKLYERTPLVELQHNAGAPDRWVENYGCSLSRLEAEWKGLIAGIIGNGRAKAFKV